jgi:hypothetical protein
MKFNTEFFFHLLVSLLADPSPLDGGCQSAQGGLCWQVGEMVFLSRALASMSSAGNDRMSGNLPADGDDRAW